MNSTTPTNKKPTLPELVDRLVAGDEAALALWCDAFTSHLVKKAKWLLKQFSSPIELDDVTSEGMLEVVRLGRDIMAGGERPQTPQSWVMDRVQFRMRDAIEQANPGVETDRNARRRRRDDAVPEFVPLVDQGVEHADFQLVDLVEEILACCADDRDRQLVTLLTSHTPSEVAQLLGLSPGNVSRRRQAIYQRYLERQCAN